MQKIIKGNILFLIVLAIAIVFTFWNLPQTFYQQDEWQVLGHNLVQGTNNIIKYTSPLQLLFGEGRPLVRALNLIFFGVFKFTIAPIAYFSLLVHLINSVLVYYLIKKFITNKVAATLGTMFFALNGVSYQAVTWAAAMNTLSATTLILLSILSYLNFFERNEKKWLFYSLFLTISSLFLKEIGSFLFIFFPILYFFYSKKHTLVENVKVNFLFITYGLLSIFFRLGELFLATDKKVGVFVMGGKGFGEKVLLHLVLYPITGLFQIFFPPLLIYDFAKKIAHLQYSFITTTPLSEIVSQTIIADMIAVIGAFTIVIFIFLINRSEKSKHMRFLILSFLLILFSFLPYAVLYRGGSYTDSRYYYLAAIGGGMLFGYIFNFFLQKKIIIAAIAIFFGSVLILNHGKMIKKEIRQQVQIGNQRLFILKTIKDSYPTLKDKNIFYITSRQDYIVPKNTLPFQQGIGYTLMVWYYQTGKIPTEFLNNNFLWDMGSQEYKEIDNKGFGFFSDFHSLLFTYKNNELSPESVISFYWDNRSNKLIDKTAEIRKLLE